jgi:hypothetical protein
VISKWVTTTIEDEAKDKVITITYFLDLMNEYSKLNNYTGLAAVLNGFRQTQIFRSKKMSHLLTVSQREFFEFVKSLLSKQGNYKRYRDTLSKSGLPCVPQINILLSDIEVYATSLPVKSGDIINFDVCSDIAQTVERIRTYQLRYYNLTAINCLQNWFFELSLEIDATALFKKSQIAVLIGNLSSSFADRFQEKIDRYNRPNAPNLMNEIQVSYIGLMSEILIV